MTRSYYGFAKDYPGTRPYRMVPPGATAYPVSAGPMCPAYGAPVMVPIAAAPGPVVGMNVNGPTAVAF